MTESEANDLGRIDGTAAAENMLDEQGIDTLCERLDGVSWLRAARQAEPHRLAGIPEALRGAYYRAYAAAATARGRWLVSLASALAESAPHRASP